MTKDEALKLALEALEQLQGGCTDHDDGTVEAITVWCPEVIEAIEAALAQPEPVVGLQCANCHLTIEALNDKVMQLMQERDFCSRCGKKLQGMAFPGGIHTCTPPNK